MASPAQHACSGVGVGRCNVADAAACGAPCCLIMSIAAHSSSQAAATWSNRTVVVPTRCLWWLQGACGGYKVPKLLLLALTACLSHAPTSNAHRLGGEASCAVKTAHFLLRGLCSNGYCILEGPSKNSDAARGDGKWPSLQRAHLHRLQVKSCAAEMHSVSCHQAGCWLCCTLHATGACRIRLHCNHVHSCHCLR